MPSNSLTLFLSAFLALSLLALCSTPATALSQPPKELTIGVLQRVEHCLRKAKKGDKLSMHYTGRLFQGEEFDSSLKRGPFSFQLGDGQVIKGWDQGLVGMCVGEKWKLTIPPQLGYGDAGAAGGRIPAGATLVFDVKLLAINDEPSQSPSHGEL